VELLDWSDSIDVGVRVLLNAGRPPATTERSHRMRIASFNVENMFRRAVALNQASWQDGKEILKQYSLVNTLMQEPVYTAAIKSSILDALEKLGVKKNSDSKFATLRENRGKLLKRPQSGPVQVVAGGRRDWVGWVELKTEAVNGVATQMTAKVIREVKADIMAVIEAEDRIALTRFNDQLLKPISAIYDGIMLIDGNDERGIDVGFLTRKPAVVESIVSHVDDMKSGKRIFSRDCVEFTVRVKNTTRILVMVNHFKSKGFGNQADSDARRKAQAKRVREIYDLRRSQGVNMIAIVGDFNDTPDSGPLKPLLTAHGSDLKDIFAHPTFQGDGRPGTYANGTAGNKIDFLLLSPDLFSRVTRGGIERRGVWGGVNGTLFPHFPEITQPVESASDHAAIFADLNL
jgi:endonuclease/exonuclease/phosphatase family metal-dependent hydrolase